ncbi:MAG: hypothetical protein ACRD1T_23985, partial [Acidimicrobiia bacterium]
PSHLASKMYGGGWAPNGVRVIKLRMQDGRYVDLLAGRTVDFALPAHISVSEISDAYPTLQVPGPESVYSAEEVVWCIYRDPGTIYPNGVVPQLHPSQPSPPESDSAQALTA